MLRDLTKPWDGVKINIISLPYMGGISLWQGGRLMTESEVKALYRAPTNRAMDTLKELGYVRYR